MSNLTRLLFLCGFVLILGVSSLVQAAQPVETQRFLSLSDLHFDPYLSCNKRPCPLIQKLQAAPAAHWGRLLSRHDSSIPVYGKDSNYQLLLSSFAAAQKEGEAAKIQFVLILGDLLAHDYDKKYFKYADDKTQAGYARFVKKTLEFLNAELKQAFPQTDVYLLIGNNDSYEKDYSVVPEGAFLKDFSQVEASLINNRRNREEFLREFPHGGYYAVDAPSQSALRLVFLNSVLFSAKAKGPQLEQAAQAQIDWLQQELKMAAKKKQQVLIAMHIPTGIDVYTTLLTPFSIVEFWKTAYSKRFLAEVQQASGQIMGVFQGHIHADAFQILSGPGQNALPFTGTPSISPIFGNNPAFKIYSYSLPGLKLVNFVTYYRSLNSSTQWEKEYDFDEVYQLNHSDSELIKGMLRLGPTGKLAEDFKTYFSVKSDSQPITKQDKWLPYYWCGIHGLTAAEYRTCLYTSTT